MKSKKKSKQDLRNFRQQDGWYFSTASTPKIRQWLYLVGLKNKVNNRIWNSTIIMCHDIQLWVPSASQASLKGHFYILFHIMSSSHIPPFGSVTHLSVLSWPLGPSLFLQTDVRPSLYTVGLLATFWNMNSSVWAFLSAHTA